ncbi:DUF3179 domain-containing (seleno)protein [Haloglomus litoreum]|uniref:DUF3179 domain-containing (seleno)protein n=1 Tax=Haloglomus litoreum TaxID=3034026 RepID=UPI0023E8FA64|nr:DUF3179 domain-containing (seleno)protein [Haloglomus sp. DT116]
MKRRAMLAAAAGLASGLAGCLAGYRGSVPGEVAVAEKPTARSGKTAPGNAGPVAESGIPATVCQEPPLATDILAIDDPAFAASWDDVTPERRYRPDVERRDLPDEAVVIGLTAGGSDEGDADGSGGPAGDGSTGTSGGGTDGDRTARRARAYPLSVLWEHEVVNDRFGRAVLVTYCPLCRSGVVADRRAAGAVTRFQVTGLLWKPPGVYGELSKQQGAVFGADGSGATEAARNGNLVMRDDATGSYWSQFLARAICGPQRGTTLDIRPATVATWGAWRREHPGTDVLLPPPHSGTVG